MEKFKVRCYYVYEAVVDVEANDIDEAIQKGYELCDAMPQDKLQYVSYQSGEIVDENGYIREFDINF